MNKHLQYFVTIFFLSRSNLRKVGITIWSGVDLVTSHLFQQRILSSIVRCMNLCVQTQVDIHIKLQHYCEIM